jgi:hypothetical protein
LAVRRLRDSAVEFFQRSGKRIGDQLRNALLGLAQSPFTDFPRVTEIFLRLARLPVNALHDLFRANPVPVELCIPT